MDEIFLSYAKEDKGEVDNIYLKLAAHGLNPWMDSPPEPHSIKGIPFGEKWDVYLESKLNSVELILIFLSKKSIEKKGYVQKEYRLALNKSMYLPASTIPLIPILLEDVDIPQIKVDTISLKDFQWYNLQQLGLDPLIKILKKRFNTTSLLSNEQQLLDLKIQNLDLELKITSLINYYEKRVDRLKDQNLQLQDSISEYQSQIFERDQDNKDLLRGRNTF